MTLKELINYLRSMLSEIDGDTPVYIYDCHAVDADVCEIGPEHINIETDEGGEDIILISNLEE